MNATGTACVHCSLEEMSMIAHRLFRSVLPLAAVGLLACNGSATPTPADEPDPPEYLGMYVVTGYFDDLHPEVLGRKSVV